MSLREHLPHLHHEQEAASAPAESPAAPGEEPFPGYARMGQRELIDDLHNHGQAELDAAERYELSHEHRTAVLNKLRYLHSTEPWQGYDAMAEDEILDRLRNADDNTIKRVRDYEHKFRNRPQIIEEAIELHHERMAAMGPREVPPYMPGGGVGSARVAAPGGYCSCSDPTLVAKSSRSRADIWSLSPSANAQTKLTVVWLVSLSEPVRLICRTSS